MGSQADPRGFVDSRPGGNFSNTRDLPPQDMVSANQSQYPGGYDYDEDQRQRFLGSIPGDAKLSQASLQSTDGSRGARDLEGMKDLNIRDNPRTNGGGGGKSSSQRICYACQKPLTGQFVRALETTFHLECFKCRDCDEVVASKFFPGDVGEDVDENSHRYPLCETDYFKRLGLLCHNCGGALRGSYVTALDRKYHIDHFTCSICPTAFGAKDSYYEHDGMVYCHYHYSTQFAARCNGCQTAILKQFVEIFRNGQDQHWHPECYMINKFWNVRLVSHPTEAVQKRLDDADTPEKREQIRVDEEQMEERTYRIWSVLSAFEETSAACISDMLLHVSNGAYMEGVLVANKFIQHVDILFGATDRLDACVMAHGLPGLTYGREAKLLCKRIVAFFTLLTKTQDVGVKRLGVTQELLSLVTGLAHYLKLLIRISLQGALKLERETRSTEGLHNFLDDLSQLDSLKDTGSSLDDISKNTDLAAEQADLCFTCQQPIDDECIKQGLRRWHYSHLQCDDCHRDIGSSGDGLDPRQAMWSENDRVAFCAACFAHMGQELDLYSEFETVTRLQQYVHLLRIALARLLSLLRSGGILPHTSDDPNLSTYDSSEGHRVSSSGQIEPPMLGQDMRSKSYGGISSNDQPSSYEQTVGEMKRLRSTRMDKHLSTSFKKARTSRIIEGPESMNIAAAANRTDKRNSAFHIVEDQDPNNDVKTDLSFGNQDALTLDDIPRIVAAEQAKEQRPNAYRHAQSKLLSGGRQPKLLGGHQRDVSGGQGEPSPGGKYPAERQAKYFSELSPMEYFIVRHVAVLTMQPLLEGHYNLETLLGLIEGRKQTFWGKLFKGNDKNKVGKKKGVFGVALETLVERDGFESTFGVGPGVLRIPSLLEESVAAMKQMDMSVEGVFRKNGNIKKLKDMAEQIDSKEEDVDLSKESPVQVAALLKKFLREMPDPLLTHKLHDLFILTQKITDEAKRQRIMHLACCILPKPNRDALEVLFSFLQWAASFSQVDEETGSKMDTHNLATVIAPNILYADAKLGQTDESFLAIEAVHMLLDYVNEFSQVPMDIQTIVNDTDLFGNTGEITTKEILKRYGEMGKSANYAPGAQTPPQHHGSVGGGSRTGAPVPTRVDTDQTQIHAWQKESSVRHVGQNGAPSFPPPVNQNTPPMMQSEFANRNSPYHQRGGSSENAGNAGTPNRHSQRPWGRQQPNQGPGQNGFTG